MAIANILFSGTYSVVDSIVYSKQNKSTTFLLQIYTNAQKTNLVASISMSVDGNHVVSEIESFEITTPPVNPQIGKFWIVPENSTGAWEDKVGKTVLPDGNGGWDEQSNEGNTVFVVDKNAYYKCGETMELTSYVGSREFEEFFNSPLVLQDGIMKCCYEFVKDQLQISDDNDI